MTYENRALVPSFWIPQPDVIKLYYWIFVYFCYLLVSPLMNINESFFLGKRSTHLTIIFFLLNYHCMSLFCRFILRECGVEVIRPLFLPPEVTSFRCRRLLWIISVLSRIVWNWDVRDIHFMPPIWSFLLGIDDSWFHFALKRLVFALDTCSIMLGGNVLKRSVVRGLY